MWLARTTDWFKLLHLPNVSWWQLLTAAPCLVVLIWIIVRLVARVNEDVDPAEADKEMLLAINDLWREGDLTEVEFRSIKSQLMTRMSASLQAIPKSARPAGSADQPGPGLNSRELGEEFSAKHDESQGADDKSSKSAEPESFASPTNVPEPTQNTSHLSAGMMASESENNEGNADADPECDRPE